MSDKEQTLGEQLDELLGADKADELIEEAVRSWLAGLSHEERARVAEEVLGSAKAD